MNTKIIIEPLEALEFVKSISTGNNVVDVAKLANGTFRVTWVENKNYTAMDGKEYPDEVWTKEDGTMILCQDLELAHARNIIRMILRQDREMAGESEYSTDEVDEIEASFKEMCAEETSEGHTIH